MSVTLQDFALTDANTQIGATDSAEVGRHTPDVPGWEGVGFHHALLRAEAGIRECEGSVRQPGARPVSAGDRRHDRGPPAGPPLQRLAADRLPRAGAALRRRNDAHGDVRAPGQFLLSEDVTSLIGQELQTHETQRLVEDYPSVIGEANRDKLTAEVRERVMKRPEFEQARKSSDFEGTVRKLIREESQAVLNPRLDMAVKIHFWLKSQTPPFASSDLSKREAVHLVETCLQGDKDSVSFTVDKATRGYTALRECAEKEGFKGSDLDDIMENSFDSRMVERLPSYLSKEAFGQAVGREMTLAKGIHDELLGSDVWPQKEERPKGLGAFSRGLLRLSHELPGVSPSRLLAFGRATDVVVKSTLGHKKPFENLNQNARALRSDPFASFERSGITQLFKISVNAFIEAPRNLDSEALLTREGPPSTVDVGTALRFNDILGPTDAKRLMALYREAAELRESGHDGLSPDVAALRELGRATALLRELEPL